MSYPTARLHFRHFILETFLILTAIDYTRPLVLSCDRDHPTGYSMSLEKIALFLIFQY